MYTCSCALVSILTHKLIHLKMGADLVTDIMCVLNYVNRQSRMHQLCIVVVSIVLDSINPQILHFKY